MKMKSWRVLQDHPFHDLGLKQATMAFQLGDHLRRFRFPSPHDTDEDIRIAKIRSDLDGMNGHENIRELHLTLDCLAQELMKARFTSVLLAV